MLTIDGSYGEGGGQVLRTSLALAAITGKSVRIENIRARRRKPGLAPQHLASVRAVAKVCGARMEGAKLNAQSVTFVPDSAPQAGTYTFDVAQAAKGGSAGSVSLILQAVLLPLVLAGGTSQLTLRGGTHVAWSPPYDYLKRVYLPALARIGIQAKVNIQKWGWYPQGGGAVQATVVGAANSSLQADGDAYHAMRNAQHAAKQGSTIATTGLSGLDLRRRGDLLRVRGVSASSNLPKHIRDRQERAALQTLRANGVNARIQIVDAPSKGRGTVMFLWTESENAAAGFTSLGELGKPAEQVAKEAVEDLLAYLKSDAAVDHYLADQLVLPLALIKGPSYFTTEAVTQHLQTSAWVVNQFLPGRVRVEGELGEPGLCRIE